MNLSWHAAGVRHIGGEMLDWSDAEPTRGRPPAGGPVPALLAARAAAAGTRVLLAGPHDETVLAAVLGAGREVTCLVRSAPDARDLAHRYADRRDLAVVCGDSAKFVPDRPFDVVMALGGIDRLASVEAGERSWTEQLAWLAALLAPGGVLLLGVANRLGVDRLAGVPPAGSQPQDGQWWPGGPGPGPGGPGPGGPGPGGPGPGGPGPGAGGPPGGPDRLIRDLAAAGLAPDRCYAAYPRPETPTLLISTGALEEAVEPDGPLGVTVSTVCRGADLGHPVVTDPAEIARTAVGAGLGARLAPGWVALARRGARDDRESSDHPELPEGVLADRHDGFALLVELARRPSGEWVRRPLQAASRQVTARRVVRDPARLAGPLPRGRLLDELLVTACAYEDPRTLRELARGYCGWLADQAEGGRVPGGVVFATTDNVVVDADRFGQVDASFALAVPVPLEVARHRALRGFGTRLLAGGTRSPWPGVRDADAIAVTLQAMAGIDVEPGTVDAAVRLEAEIGATLGGLPPAEEEALVEALRQGTVAPPAELLGYRELLAAGGRLRDELAAAAARTAWAQDRLSAEEATVKQLRESLRGKDSELRAVAEVRAKLRDSDAELRRLREEVQLRNANYNALRRSVSFRLGRVLTAPARWVVRIFRSMS